MKRVLIVEDEKDIGLLLKAILVRQNMEVIIARDLKNGFARFSAENFDLVFLDLNLPDGSGFDMLKKIKEEKPQTRIVINSAYDGNLERTKAELLGADYFIGKPFTQKNIMDAIASLGED